MKRTFRVTFATLAILLTGFFVYSQLSDNNFLSKKILKKKGGVTNIRELRTGDIIFQTTSSRQCKAVQLATHSKYSHCGMLFKDNTGVFVIEAIQPVCITPFDEWISRGVGGHYVIQRLKNADKVITKDVEAKLKKTADEYVGKNYDIYFGWDDDAIYCSELVWKVYKRVTGIELGKLQKLKDFDLTSDAVKLELKERYGNKIPLEEPVISPSGIMESELLTTVKSE